ncbi:uncharacterized protein [Haliotis asinina]|uniref:uncharacterized protein n=1 Tax=Haliotis asinina TaxID=109174 RepID=UPI0035328067
MVNLFILSTVLTKYKRRWHYVTVLLNLTRRKRYTRMGLLSFCVVAVMLGVVSSQADIATTVFHQLDAAKNNYLTLANFNAYFNQFDLDGNGSITKQDYYQLDTNHAHADKQFALYDVDKDGVLTLKDVKIIVGKFDVDGDGKITMAEFTANYAKLLVGTGGAPVGK